MKTPNTMFVLAATILLTATSPAQITLTADRNPVVGDRVNRALMDTTGVLEGHAGANRTWDFSTVVPTGDSTTVVYINPALTPAAADFPTASVATEYIQGDDSAYTYFAASGTHYALLGMATLDMKVVYSNAEVLQTFPFSYNSEFNDISMASFDIEEIHVERKGAINVKGDAHGTIMLPNGVSMNALRVRIEQLQVDTTYLDDMPVFTTTTRTTSYQWHTTAGKFPVFGISYIEINSNGFTSRSKSVAMASQSGTVGVEEPVNTTPATLALAQNYPNPFNPSTVIRYSIPTESRVTLDVYNLIGQKVAVLVSDEMQSAGDYEAEFTAKNLPSGVYLYRLKAGSQVEIRKLTIVK